MNIPVRRQMQEKAALGSVRASESAKCGLKKWKEKA